MYLMYLQINEIFESDIVTANSFLREWCQSTVCMKFMNMLIAENYNEQIYVDRLQSINRILQNKLPRIYKSTQNYVQEQVELRKEKEEVLTFASSFIDQVDSELTSRYVKQETLDSYDKTWEDVNLIKSEIENLNTESTK